MAIVKENNVYIEYLNMDEAATAIRSLSALQDPQIQLLLHSCLGSCCLLYLLVWAVLHIFSSLTFHSNNDKKGIPAH